MILSTRWSEADINSLSFLNEFFKKNKMDFTIVSTAPEFNFKNKIYSNLNLKHINKQLFNSTTIMDRHVLLKNEIPNDIEKKYFEKLYFKRIKNTQIEINNKLKKQSKVMNINFLDLFEIFCNLKYNTCDVLTESNEKIHTDSSGHISLSGSKFFGEKIYNSNVYSKF